MTAVELLESNLQTLRKNSQGIKNISAVQGDVLDLSDYSDGEFEGLFASKPVEHITTAAVDWILEIARGREDFSILDKDMKLFTEYHIATCQKRENLGNSSHLLYVCQKTE